MITGNAFYVFAESLLSPIFAIFVVNKIAPGQIKIVGFAIAIFWLTKSIIQIPLAKYLDKTKKEDDDLFALVVGASIIVLVPIFYIFINSVYVLFLVQIIHAVGAALYVFPWNAMFTRHIDKKQIGFEWSMNSSALGFGVVIAAFFSGLIAEYIGFNAVFIIAAIFFALTSVIYIKLYKILIKDHKNNLQKSAILSPEQKILK